MEAGHRHSSAPPWGHASIADESRPLAPLALIAPLFMLSGATALLYQVAFGNKLAGIFGATAYAVSAVLAAFMGGLALGSHLGGRLGARVERPLLVYGVAEIIVGAICALTPYLFDGIAAAYQAAAQALPSSLAVVTALRGIVAGLVVLIPTLAMGVTLPMLAKEIAGRRGGGRGDARRRLAVLYAMNTAGGALGALASAYMVMPRLGVDATMRAAALVNLSIGLIAAIAGRRERAAAVEDHAPPSELATPAGLLMALAAASGVLVFGVEVVDTHLLTLILGDSAQAFGLMLAVFLCCLSVGAALAQPLEQRFGQKALPIALVTTSLTLLATSPLWSRLPHIFAAVGELAVVAVLAVPTTSMGLTFPLLLRAVAHRADVAQQVGRLTAINTLGSIVGSLACGYLLLPLLGAEDLLRLIAVVFAGCALFASRWPSPMRAQRRAPENRAIPLADARVR